MAAAFTEAVVDVRAGAADAEGGTTGIFPPLVPLGRVFPPACCTASLMGVKRATGTGFGAVTAPKLLLAASAGRTDRSRAAWGARVCWAAPAETVPNMTLADTIETVTAVTTTPRQRTTAPIENTGFTNSQAWTDDLTDRSATPLRKTHRTRTVAQGTLRNLA